MTPRRTTAAAFGARAVVLALLASPAAAEAPGVDGLTLQQVVDAALAGGVDILLAAEQVRLGEGELLNSRAPFDTVMATRLSRGRVEETVFGDTGALGAVAVTTETGAYSLDLSRRFRSGITVRPEVVTSQLQLDGLARTPSSSTAVNLELVVPLLRDRWGRVVRTAEEAAEVGSRADRFELDHQRSLSAFAAASAYWSYLGAYRQLDVFATSQARAELLVDETRQLVDAEERPAAELNQVLGNAASKRIDRIRAEQDVAEARRRLGVAMGIFAADIPRLPPPATDFPAPRPFDAAAAVPGLVDSALGRRADLRAAGDEEASAELLLDGARDELKPALDVALTTGYSGLAGDADFGGIFDSFHRNVPGASASLLVSYRLPVSNAAARGRALQRQAVHRQQQIVRDELERLIASVVAVAAEDVMRSAMADEEAQRAVELSRNTVENEKEKNRLGLATLFDVILAEDRLTSALLSTVGTRLSYAQAVARLRFETGALVVDPGGVAGVDAELMMSAP